MAQKQQANYPSTGEHKKALQKIRKIEYYTSVKMSKFFTFINMNKSQKHKAEKTG